MSNVDSCPHEGETDPQMNAISPELIAIIGASIALAALILPGLNAMRRDIADLRERMARLEGTVDVLSKFLIDREHRSAREVTT